MVEIQIGDGLFIVPAHFGEYSQNIVHGVLGAISSNIDMLTGVENKLACHVMESATGVPMCCNWMGGHAILLTVKGDYWCQWVYQFAHEYMHHIICGDMSGRIQGLIWLEETLCELSSLYQLALFHQICLMNHAIPSLQHFAPAILDYQHDLLVSHLDLKRQFQSPGVVSRWLPLLSEPRYHRDHYNAIACHILPLFQENPHLWRMTAHMGDSRQYQTLGDLWEHLRRCAEGSWRDSLEKLILSLS